MARDIKFRVWDNEENKFFEPIYKASKGNLLDLSIGLGGDLLRRTLEIPTEHQSCFPNRYELQQFTGLKDKNGVDIYEGDIVKCDFGDLYNKEKGFKVIKWDTITNGWGISNDWAKRFETIGNVYENPELLLIELKTNKPNEQTN